jgi:hypothetical protein
VWLRIERFFGLLSSQIICSRVLTRMAYNGPAIWGGCVTRRRIRSRSRYFSQKAVTVQGGYGTCFCRHGTNFIEHYACRGTILIGAGKLSRYRIFVEGTGAVSRYKLSRSQKTVTVQDFNGGRCACPGARTITNLS